jgi:hypothetical protein
MRNCLSFTGEWHVAQLCWICELFLLQEGIFDTRGLAGKPVIHVCSSPYDTDVSLLGLIYDVVLHCGICIAIVYPELSPVEW